MALTQARLAQRASIGTSYLARIEGGTRQPTLEVLLRIADGLGVSPGELFSQTKVPTRARAAIERELLVAIRGLPEPSLEPLLALVRGLRQGR
jgi:transcriptional regulator with XRE-family HTH domain